MSVRAYKIRKIDYANNDTFNLWHHNKLNDLLEENGFYDTLVDGTGITEIPVDILEEALKKDLADDNDKEEEKYIKDNIRKDIKWAKKRGRDYIQYYCF